MDTTSFDVGEVHLSAIRVEGTSTKLVHSTLSVPLEVERVCTTLGANDCVPSILGGSAFRVIECSGDRIHGNLFNFNRLWVRRRQ
jgi:hypothetical protein